MSHVLYVYICVQNLTIHRGEDMYGYFEHGPLTTFNYVKLHYLLSAAASWLDLIIKLLNALLK